MPQNNFTREEALNQLQSFFTEQPLILFGTGTSCAVNPDFGMANLSEKLISKIQVVDLEGGSKLEWDRVKTSLEEGRDLESSLNEVQNEGLIQQIVEVTANSLIDLNREFCDKILSGEIRWGAMALIQRLYKKMLDGQVLQIATPNYDLLAEAAFCKENISYTTGFIGGILRRRDWGQAKRAFCFPSKTVVRKKQVTVWKIGRHIELIKVHGSLNTFEWEQRVVECDHWASLSQKSLESSTGSPIKRVMITPGMSKYKGLHDRRAQLLDRFDSAVKKHRHFLFLGFGFNDNHLVNKDVEAKLMDQHNFGLILTKDNNDRIRELLDKAPNLWLVCESQTKNGTEIHNQQFEKPLNLEGETLWDAEQFAITILGG